MMRQRHRLGDLIRIKHGFAFKGEYFSEFGDAVIVTPGNFNEFGGFRFKSKGEKYYSGPIPDDYILNSGDIIVAMTEQAPGLLGSAAKVPSAGLYLHNQRIGLVQIVGRDHIDADYLYYIFNCADVRSQISASANGAKVRHTSPTRIYDVSVDLPSVNCQRRIAYIISTYEVAIENNTRRIAILDEMARRLFDEWFVQFRFPGRTERRSGEQLPEGWCRVPIKQIYDGLFDGPHATPKPSDEGPVFLGIGNITAAGHLDLSSVRHISEQEFPKWTKRVTPEEGDIVFTYEATLNRYALIPPGFRGCLGRRLALIRVAPERQHNLFLYYYFFSPEWRQVIAANILSGATVDRIPLTTFPEFPIVLPPEDLVRRFDAIVRPMVRETQILGRQNDNLRAARDLLLPKLISGEIDVGGAPLPGELAAE